jgi:hypothetical protein
MKKTKTRKRKRRATESPVIQLLAIVGGLTIIKLTLDKYQHNHQLESQENSSSPEKHIEEVDEVGGIPEETVASMGSQARFRRKLDL